MESKIQKHNTAPEAKERKHIPVTVMNLIVLALSVILIVYLSVETFNNVIFTDDSHYMWFQFWVCVVFILDFFVGLYYSGNRWLYFKHRIMFLLLSIPYLNIIHALDIQLTYDAMYFVRFIPLARGALAMSIVMGYLSKNAITSLFVSYIVITILIIYFSSLIFYQRELGINPQVNSYWTALWWAAMNMATVGCYINPVTVAGKIVAVILPITGMILFPLFTVYLTNYVQRTVEKMRQNGSANL